MARRAGWHKLLLCFLAFLCSAADSSNAQFVGSETCALCHPAIAASQKQSAMATTWQGRGTPWLSSAFQAVIADDLAYEFKRADTAFNYSVEFGGSRLTLPIEAVVGGQRHGFGFLASFASTRWHSSGAAGADSGPLRVVSREEPIASGSGLRVYETANARRGVGRHTESDIRSPMLELPWPAQRKWW